MINDDTLTLYFYNDGLSDDERAEVESALNSDANLAARYDLICRQMTAWSNSETPAAPSHLPERWHDSIDHAARMETAAPKIAKPSPFQFLTFAWGGGLAAALALGIALGMYFSGNEVMPIDQGTHNELTQSALVPAAFTRGLKVHLQESQWEITSLPDNNPTDNTQLLMQIVEQNRMFERAAKQNNSQNIARLLRAFEPILIRLASEDIAPEDAEALRAQLAFELNVMLTKMARDPSKEAHTT